MGFLGLLWFENLRPISETEGKEDPDLLAVMEELRMEYAWGGKVWNSFNEINNFVKILSIILVIVFSLL